MKGVKIPCDKTGWIPYPIRVTDDLATADDIGGRPMTGQPLKDVEITVMVMSLR